MGERLDDFIARLPRKVVASGAFVTNADGQVLVVKPTYKPGWEIPGGCVEDGESARDACVRELAEELGIAPRIGRLLVVEHQTAPEDKGDPIMFVYDGGVVEDVEAPRLASDEVEQACFVDVEALADYLPLRQSRRMAAAARAQRDGTVAELINGVDVVVPTVL